MKKLHIRDNIITFVTDTAKPETPLSDIELVLRLANDPHAHEEVRALARLVHLLATQETG